MQSGSGRLGSHPIPASWLPALEVAAIFRGGHTLESWQTAATQSTLAMGVILKDKGFLSGFCSSEDYCVPRSRCQAAHSKLRYPAMPQLHAGKMLTEWRMAAQRPPLQPRATSFEWPGGRISPLGTVSSYQDSGV